MLKLNLNIASSVAPDSELDSGICESASFKPNYVLRSEKHLNSARVEAGESGEHSNPMNCSNEKILQGKNRLKKKISKYHRKLAITKNKMKLIKVRKAKLNTAEETLQHISEKAENLLAKIDWLKDNMPANLRRERGEVLTNVRYKAVSLGMVSEEMKNFAKELKEELEVEKKGYDGLLGKYREHLVKMEEIEQKKYRNVGGEITSCEYKEY